MSDTDPRVVHQVDQHMARLRDLVGLVRDHRDAHACRVEVPCPGEWAWAEVIRMTCHHRAGLLALALAELAALGYGLPATADAYELTEDARRLLDDDGPVQP